MASKNTDTDVISARVSKSLAEAVRAIAKAQGMSVNDYTTECLRAGVMTFAQKERLLGGPGRGLLSRLIRR